MDINPDRDKDLEIQCLKLQIQANNQAILDLSNRLVTVQTLNLEAFTSINAALERLNAIAARGAIGSIPCDLN